MYLTSVCVLCYRGKNKGPPIEIIPDEPREQYIPGCNSVSVISMAICKAAACVKDACLYNHIAQLKSEQVSIPFKPFKSTI